MEDRVFNTNDILNKCFDGEDSLSGIYYDSNGIFNAVFDEALSALRIRVPNMPVGATGPQGPQGPQGDQGDSPDPNLYIKREDLDYIIGYLKFNFSLLETYLQKIYLDHNFNTNNIYYERPSFNILPQNKKSEYEFYPKLPSVFPLKPISVDKKPIIIYPKVETIKYVDNTPISVNSDIGGTRVADPGYFTIPGFCGNFKIDGNRVVSKSGEDLSTYLPKVFNIKDGNKVYQSINYYKVVKTHNEARYNVIFNYTTLVDGCTRISDSSIYFWNKYIMGF